MTMLRKCTIFFAVLAIAVLARSPVWAQGTSGSTLQASKTLDICVNSDGTWRYFGEVSIWNTGANTAEGLNITDCLQYKTATQKKEPQDLICLANVQGTTTTIAGLTQEIDAIRFSYDFSSVYTAPLDLSGVIRNSAVITITNHSGRQVNGPNPKFTWTGGTPPSCTLTCGCTFTQGYWDNKPGVVWPAPYYRDALFFNSGLTYQEIMNASVAGGNAYINLAHQYIAAVLNVASGACAPSSVNTYTTLAQGFFTGFATGSSFCGSSASACALQVTWAGILADYNERTGAYASEQCPPETP